jgi:mannitol/fructose-specific phosphotransferase system IIA component (Ntr-type)/CBS domain-containing protein
MKLANLLVEQRINMDLKAWTKEEAVRELLNMLVEEGVGFDYDRVMASVREREEVEDTSYGHGFAFPHARTDEVKELIVLIGVSKKGLEGKTADGVRLHVVCLLLTPSTIARLYLQTLSGLASLARTKGALEKILSFDHPFDLVQMIADRNVTVDKELLVRDVMRHKVASVTPNETLMDVANKMFKNRLSALAVVDEHNKLLGVINDRDLIKAALPNYRSLIEGAGAVADVEPFEELLKKEQQILVSQLYRSDYEVCLPETRVVEVAAMMIFKDVRRVFVVQGDCLMGVLLRKDIVNMVIRG